VTDLKSQLRLSFTNLFNINHGVKQFWRM